MACLVRLPYLLVIAGRSWMRRGCPTGRRGTWAPCTASNGGTLVPSTRTCTQTTQVGLAALTVARAGGSSCGVCVLGARLVPRFCAVAWGPAASVQPVCQGPMQRSVCLSLLHYCLDCCGSTLLRSLMLSPHQPPQLNSPCTFVPLPAALLSPTLLPPSSWRVCPQRSGRGPAGRADQPHQVKPIRQAPHPVGLEPRGTQGHGAAALPPARTGGWVWAVAGVASQGMEGA